MGLLVRTKRIIAHRDEGKNSSSQFMTSPSLPDFIEFLVSPLEILGKDN